MDIKFKKIKYQQISTSHGRNLRLRAEPGVYAWFRDFNLREYIKDKNGFLNRIEELLNVNLSDTFHSKIGVLYDVILTEKGGFLTTKKKELLELICEQEVGRKLVADIFLTISEIQSPLYIGKAIDIRSRITEHITGQSELSERLLKASIDLNDCYIRVIYFDSNEIKDVIELLPEKDLDSFVVLIEDLITRLGPAAFVRRPG